VSTDFSWYLTVLYCIFCLFLFPNVASLPGFADGINPARVGKEGESEWRTFDRPLEVSNHRPMYPRKRPRQPTRELLILTMRFFGHLFVRSFINCLYQVLVQYIKHTYLLVLDLLLLASCDSFLLCPSLCSHSFFLLHLSPSLLFLSLSLLLVLLTPRKFNLQPAKLFVPCMQASFHSLTLICLFCRRCNWCCK
jgi:hypothetical protein